MSGKKSKKYYESVTEEITPEDGGRIAGQLFHRTGVGILYMLQLSVKILHTVRLLEEEMVFCYTFGRLE